MNYQLAKQILQIPICRRSFFILRNTYALYHRRIFEHLGETLDFLKAHFRLKFCVFQPFYHLRSMLRVQKTPVHPFLASLSGPFPKYKKHMHV